MALLSDALRSAVLLTLVVAGVTSARDAAGRFEVYCDGVGFFMTKVDRAPQPRKLFVFLYTDIPGVPYVSKGEWKEVNVYRHGCVADGKCDVLAHGQIRLTNELTPDSRHVLGD